MSDTRREEIREMLSDARLADLDSALASLAEMGEEEDEGWRWIDQDPSVAWQDPSGFYGRSRAAMIDAGWEDCDHRHSGRSALHLRVKLDGNGRYRGYADRAREIESERGDGFNREQFDRIAQEGEEWERESGWDEARWMMGSLLGLLARDGTGSARDLPQLYSGGNGGWMEIPREMESDPEAASYFASWIGEMVDSMNSIEAGRWIAESALEQYDEIRFADLASPRSSAMSDLALSWQGGSR